MNATMHVRGCALWSPEYADADAWLAGTRSEPPTAAPPAELLPRRVRGRASLLTCMIAEVVARVAREGGADLTTVPLIVGSAYGEMATTAQLLAMMRSDDGALSPARFQASVHNAAAGAISIATANRGFSSCLSAGEGTGAAVLIEAHAWLAAHGGQVIVAAADESLPGFFAGRDRFGPLALSMLLDAAQGAGGMGCLGPPVHAAAAVQAGVSREASDEAFALNPVAPLLTVLRAVRAGRNATVALPAGSGWWRFEFTPGERLP